MKKLELESWLVVKMFFFQIWFCNNEFGSKSIFLPKSLFQNATFFFWKFCFLETTNPGEIDILLFLQSKLSQTLIFFRNLCFPRNLIFSKNFELKI